MKKFCLILALAILFLVPTHGVYSEPYMRASRTADLIIYLRPHLDPEIAAIHARYIDRYSSKWHVDRLKVISIANLESEFRADAKNPSGCIGAMQVNPRVHQDKLTKRRITLHELFYLKNNYDVGSEILHDCLKSSRSFEEALYKYSGGSKNYTRDVKKIYGRLSRLSQLPSIG
jgi:soluble lytic murein transglycosylase-like protein